MAERFLHLLIQRFRRERMREFERIFSISNETRILDVGGTPPNWRLLGCRPRVTLLNMPRAQEDPEGHPWVAGDACRLPFADNSFDLVFSNSVIEHVGSWERQKQFAAEAARVGRSYYVQTPNRGFPIEPHLLTPFLHFLPEGWQRWLVRRFTVWEFLTRPSRDRAEFYREHYLEDIRLLSLRQMRELFPDAVIRRERFLGLTKSLIAVKRGEPSPHAKTLRPQEGF